MRKRDTQMTPVKSGIHCHLDLHALNRGNKGRVIKTKGHLCISILFACLLCCQPVWAQSQASSLGQQGSPQPVASMEPLTNRDIVEMVKAGLATEIILAKIRSTPTEFDTSPAALRELKAVSVPDAVILAMVQAPAESQSETQSARSQATMPSAADQTQTKLSAHTETTPLLAGRADKPRVFITDSKSWQMSGGFGGNPEGFGGGVQGGARPQTAEIIKTFGERCSECVVTSKVEKADYVVLLEHEGGKGLARKDNKFAVFTKDGDLIASGSTRSLGNAVKDACAAIMSVWVRKGGARDQK